MGLGSEIRDLEKNLFRISDPGVKKASDPRSRSATLMYHMKEKNKRKKEWHVATKPLDFRMAFY